MRILQAQNMLPTPVNYKELLLCVPKSSLRRMVDCRNEVSVASGEVRTEEKSLYVSNSGIHSNPRLMIQKNTQHSPVNSTSHWPRKRQKEETSCFVKLALPNCYSSLSHDYSFSSVKMSGWARREAEASFFRSNSNCLNHNNLFSIYSFPLSKASEDWENTFFKKVICH